MKCHGCGHEFAHTSSRCPRCHRSTSRRGRTSTDSRLLEFPRRTRVAPPAEASARPLPAWRVELNEKVRTIRANRGATVSTAEPAVQEILNPLESETRPTNINPLLEEGRGAYERAGSRVAAPRTEPSQPPAAQSGGTSRRSSNNIVEAALTRVKRASENASRAALPKIEPARSIQPTQGSLAVDRQATARALEPMPEVEPSIELKPAPRPEVIQPPAIVQPAVTTPLIVEPIAAAESSILQTSYAEDVEEPSPVLILEEIEPLDYLEAEVRKVDKALGAEFKKNESPSIVTHAVIGIVDLIAIALSCSPFLAIVMIADGSFAIGETKLATGVIVSMIALFYLALTQCLCGRTFGMMLTNTRVVDAQSFEAPSPAQALLRTGGYIIAVAPALAGILWTAFDNRHRGWQDHISRTVVVRDF